MTMPAIEGVHTRPKSKALFDRIRTHVLEGHFPPGHWLKQAELEETYNATRSEVRAALSSLSERGMVEYVQNRGFRIFNRSQDEISQIVEMITILEAAAADGIIRNATPAQVAELTALANEFDGLIESGSHSELRLLNYRLHSKINQLCGNDLIARTIQNLRECCITGPFGRYTSYDGLKASSREHFAIIRLIEARDVSGLSDILRSHSSHAD
ncbi:MAG TPA: GntR family transcriptional regulator [Rhizomicrobium sp.]|nr:GntR family transcriptional regulator [Rhizomicrobium sp.]